MFQRLFEAAEIARFDPSEREAYEESIKVYRDLKNVMDTRWEEGQLDGVKQGLQQGLQQGLKQMAKAMKAAKEPVAKIVKYTGLTPEQIAEL